MFGFFNNRCNCGCSDNNLNGDNGDCGCVKKAYYCRPKICCERKCKKVYEVKEYCVCRNDCRVKYEKIPYEIKYVKVPCEIKYEKMPCGCGEGDSGYQAGVNGGGFGCDGGGCEERDCGCKPYGAYDNDVVFDQNTVYCGFGANK
ncbi:MAG: hypothetical protein LBQ40_07045 [Clostridiales bacterium]|nr:hypothetical protein [Clostridiales bacterium]